MDSEETKKKMNDFQDLYRLEQERRATMTRMQTVQQQLATEEDKLKMINQQKKATEVQLKLTDVLEVWAKKNSMTQGESCKNQK